jgi:RNA polymerase sigma-54 factor
MGMAFDLTIQQHPALELRPSAELVAYAHMLVASTPELERLVDRELRENPALERAEPSGDSSAPLAAAVPASGLATAAPAARDAPDEPGLLARIALEARADLPARDRGILDFVLGSVDDHGFLTLDVAEIARLLSVPEERVAGVVDVVRGLGPAGFASRDVRECLTIQLDGLRADPRLVALARRLIASSLDDLAAGRYGALARRLGVDRGLVIAARDLIRARLRPFPVLDTALRGARHEATGTPEVLICATADGLRVELTEERRFQVRVNPLYDAIDSQHLTGGDRRAMAAQARDGRAFVRRLRERWATIRCVLEHTAREQRAFVLHGPAALVPLTQAQVAAAVGVHESTVSRVVAGRSALLPCGRVIELRDFFCASLSAREALRTLIAHEQRPLSDDELAARLRDGGHRVARRTVAKYRGLLDIPPAARH